MIYIDRLLIKIGTYVGLLGMAYVWWVGLFYLLGWLP